MGLFLYMMKKQKVIVYVDGFNFYYGLKKDKRWRQYYWLDMVRFFELGLKENQELVDGGEASCVCLFSAKSLFK